MDETWRAASAHYQEGNRLWRTGRALEAIDAYGRALHYLPDHPDIHLNLGNAQLCLGRDAEGWANYQQRLERRNSEAHKLSFPEWQGEPLAGRRLFIWSEQGLGDQIFAVRFALSLAAEHVTFVTAAPLAPLFEQLPFQIVARAPDTAIEVTPHYDYWTLPLSLPQWCKPRPTPYLRAAPRRSEGHIGIMWRGNAVPDPGRSLPQHFAEQLLSLPGAISLQPEDTGARDMRDTAEIVAGLALVITIDTSIAHLTGALGKPGIVLLQPYASDWRWREAAPGVSAWYPSLRLLRQATPGDWQIPVMAARQLAATGQLTESSRT